MRPGGTKKVSTEFERLTEQTQHRSDLRELLQRADAGHADRVAEVAYAIALQLGQTTPQASAIASAARWHDVGKAIVEQQVLNKPGPLTTDERLRVNRHVWFGHTILVSRSTKANELAANVALLHHEHFDGSGHPFGLRGHATPLAARIASVADVFDALLTERPYKRAWSKSETIRYIQAERERQFDPACVDALIAITETDRRFFEMKPAA